MGIEGGGGLPPADLRWSDNEEEMGNKTSSSGWVKTARVRVAIVGIAQVLRETGAADRPTMGNHEARGDDFEKKAEKKLIG
jgi:hypothetical protein